LARLSNADLGDPLAVAVAERWTALTRPEESAELIEAMAALKAAEAALDKFHADDRAGFYSGRSARYRMPAKQEAEQRVNAAEERVSALSGGAVDISFLLNGQAAAAWEGASESLRRDLFGLAVDSITVTRAPKQGVRFNGDSRCDIRWAEVAEEYETAA
jgi:hypothetical protein